MGGFLVAVNRLVARLSSLFPILDLAFVNLGFVGLVSVVARAYMEAFTARTFSIAGDYLSTGETPPALRRLLTLAPLGHPGPRERAALPGLRRAVPPRPSSSGGPRAHCRNRAATRCQLPADGGPSCPPRERDTLAFPGYSAKPGVSWFIEKTRRFHLWPQLRPCLLGQSPETHVESEHRSWTRLVDVADTLQRSNLVQTSSCRQKHHVESKHR